jgi:Domain of unknown function (DUF4178)
VARIFTALKPGDGLTIESVAYIASGQVVLRGPDGSVWSEWLLIPRGMTASHAVHESRQRWLCRDEHGLSLWTPTSTPPGFDAERLARGGTATVDGHSYRVSERDSCRVDRVEGDVGGECQVSEQYEYAELRNGLSLLSVEWNARGVALLRGRRAADHEMFAWSQAADGALAARARASGAGGSGLAAAGGASPMSSGMVSRGRVSNAATTEKRNNWMVAGGIGAMLALIMALESCDDDCRQRTNPVTGQQETVCDDDDGIRSRKRSRSYGGWSGK